MTEKRVMIAAGGTGGHVFPGISIAEALSKMSDVKIEIIISTKPIDQEVSKHIPWETITFNAPKIMGRSKLTLPLAGFKILRSIINANVLLKKFKPNVVIGIGGFIGGPIVLAAYLRGIPSVIIEPNAVAGRANRMLGHFAKRICVGFAATTKYFPEKKVRLTGNPIRSEIIENLNGHGDSLIILGGSQGAANLNKIVVDAIPFFKSEDVNPKIIHQTGKRGIDEIRRAYEENGVEAVVAPFVEDISSVYKSGRLAISRSGASAVAELAAAKLPSIFVPYPFAADDHQFANAKGFSDAGGAVLCREESLNGEELGNLIAKLWKDEVRLEKMRTAMGEMAKPEAAKNIAQVCKELMGE